MPRLCKVYPGTCLTTEDKAWKNLSQGSRFKKKKMWDIKEQKQKAKEMLQKSSAVVVKGAYK